VTRRSSPPIPSVLSLTCHLRADCIPLRSQELTDIKKQSQSLPGKDVEMDPLAEFTKLECWDENGKPYLKEVSPDTPCSTIARVVVSGSTAHILAVRRFGEDEGEDRDNYWR